MTRHVNERELRMDERLKELEVEVFGEAQDKSEQEPEPVDRMEKLRKDALRFRKAKAAGEPTEPEGDSKPPNVNLNLAGLQELQSINHVGEKTAEDILAHRDEAPFESIEDAAERVGGLSLGILQEAGATV